MKRVSITVATLPQWSCFQESTDSEYRGGVESVPQGTTMPNWIVQHPSILGIIAPAYFIFLWLVVTTIVSYASGWTALAGRYTSSTPFAGAQWSWKSGQMQRRVGYGNCLVLGAGPQGFYLATMWFFRFHHAPLLIPWSEISMGRRKRFLFEYLHLELDHELRIPLRLRLRDAESLRHAAGSFWPVEQIG